MGKGGLGSLGVQAVGSAWDVRPCVYRPGGCSG